MIGDLLFANHFLSVQVGGLVANAQHDIESTQKGIHNSAEGEAARRPSPDD